MTIDGTGLIRYLKPLLMGQNPLDRERLNARSGAPRCDVRSIGAVDVALWDLAGKAADCRSIACSVPSANHPGLCSSVIAPPEAYAEEAIAVPREWLGRLQDPSAARWREDIKVCEAVREAVGDDYTLMLEFTWSYESAAALRVGRAIEELGLLLV